MPLSITNTSNWLTSSIMQKYLNIFPLFLLIKTSSKKMSEREKSAED
jgi:hypothetical protein